MASDRELSAMRHAIALSAHGLGTTSPNPPVGCVILDQRDEIVGTGFHRRKGEAHAEAHALADAGPHARGGTAVVTLEPCNHFGRTPPCHQGLIDAGVERVVIALLDPTSRGEGGVARLRAAGIGVEVGVLGDEAKLVLGPWLDALARQRPDVIATVDGGPLPWLLASTDVVVAGDGSVREAIPGSHGTENLNLPDNLLLDRPREGLKLLYAAGVRTVLLNAPEDRIHEFAQADCVDRIVLTSSDFEAPPGFRLTHVRKVDEVTIECVYLATESRIHVR